MGLAGLSVGVVQLWLGWIGIEHHLGEWAAVVAVLAVFFLRLMLAMTIGTYFGAVDVIGWPWWTGILIADPGIVFVIPA